MRLALLPHPHRGGVILAPFETKTGEEKEAREEAGERELVGEKLCDEAGEMLLLMDAIGVLKVTPTGLFTTPQPTRGVVGDLKSEAGLGVERLLFSVLTNGGGGTLNLPGS